MNTVAGTQSQSLLWGVGLFETMLVLHDRVLHETMHFARMCEAARALRLPVPEARQWQAGRARFQAAPLAS